MKTVKRVSWILGLIIGGGLFLSMVIQSPTLNVFRLLGQLLGSVAVGIIVFWIVYGLGLLVVRIKK